jgi:hypothetical protein
MLASPDAVIHVPETLCPYRVRFKTNRRSGATCRQVLALRRLRTLVVCGEPLTEGGAQAAAAALPNQVLRHDFSSKSCMLGC